MPDTEIPSVDNIIKTNDENRARQLQAQFSQAEGGINRQIGYETQAITRQYEIKRADMRRKYDAADPEKKKSILDQTHSLRSQTMAKLQAINDKYTPAKDELGKTLEIEMQKIAQENQQRNFRLQNIRQLVQAGHMDATEAKKAEYKLIGINWQPPKTASPEAKKAQLVRDIKTIDARLAKFTPGDSGEGIWNLKSNPKYVDPFTGEERKLNPKNENDALIIKDMRNLNIARTDLINELQNTLISENPTIKARLDRINQFKTASEQAKNGGRSNIETAIRNEIGNQNKNKRVRVQSPTGQTGTVSQNELDTFIAQGYKRI
jgi:hypothetical protein